MREQGISLYVSERYRPKKRGELTEYDPTGGNWDLEDATQGKKIQDEFKNDFGGWNLFSLGQPLQQTAGSAIPWIIWNGQFDDCVLRYGIWVFLL